MNNENVLKKIIINSLLGFPIGITMLMINYACIYLYAGENVFMGEIAQLQNIETFLLQLIVAGFACFLYFIAINIISQLFDIKSSSSKIFITQHQYKAMLILLIDTLIYGLVFVLLIFDIFSDNISMMNITSFAIIFILSNIYRFIRVIVDSNLVKKINQKLKERNK